MSKSKGELICDMEEEMSVIEMEDKMEEEKEELEQMVFEREQEIKEYYAKKLKLPLRYKPKFELLVMFMMIPTFITILDRDITPYPFMISVAIIILLGFMEWRKEKWVDKNLKKEYPGLFKTDIIKTANNLEDKDGS